MIRNYSRVVFVLIFFYLSCSTSKNPARFRNQRVFDLKSKEGSFNIDSTYVMCINPPIPEGYQMIFVVNLNDTSVVFSQNLLYPEVKWIDTFKIEISRGLGIINNSNGREISILDIRTSQIKIVNKEHIKK